MFVQQVTFASEGPRLRRVDLRVSTLDSSIFAPSQESGDVLRLGSQLPVMPGVRIEMRFTTGVGTTIAIDGTTRHYTVERPGGYTIHVAVEAQHQDQLSALRDCVEHGRAGSTD